MTDSEVQERLARLEQRIEKIETTVKWAEDKLLKTLASPQARKVMKMLGVNL